MKLLQGVIAIFFPWIFFLIIDNPGKAIVALGLQCTIIGWPVAIAWAFKDLSTLENEKKGSNA